MSLIINQKRSLGQRSTTSGVSSDWLKRLLEKAGLEKKAAGPPPAVSGTLPTLQAVAAQRKAGTTYNGTYKQSGSFRFARSIEIRWRQAPPIKGQKYPPRAQAISFELYENGKRLSGYRLTGPAYLDSNGKIYIPMRSPRGFPTVFRSEQSFYSNNYKVLVKALNQFRTEYKYIQKHGWKNLSFAIRNKKGKIVGTRSTLLVGALIKKIGAKAIINSKKKGATPGSFADRMHDSILRMLNNKVMGSLVHRMAEVAGVKVSLHPTRGRRLVDPAETSAAGEARGQYTGLDLINNAPAAPWVNMITQMQPNGRGRQRWRFSEEQVRQAQRMVRQVMNDPQQRNAYADQVANYLMNQRAVFANPPDGDEHFQGFIRGILNYANNLRNGRITRAEYNTYINRMRGFIPSRGVTMNFDQLLNVLGALPAFLTTDAALTRAVDAQLRGGEEAELLAEQMGDQLNLPEEIARSILFMAMALSFVP